MTKVAVVAVHGVADQEPKSSAREVAKLLSPDNGYSKFREADVEVRLRPVHASYTGTDPALRYMNAQLEGYERARGGAARHFETIRLEGKRASGKGSDDVHVYEFYWADLSRAGKTWYRLLAEFYQLILHLPSLGRNGLRAAAEAQPTWTWKIASVSQSLAVWLLTVAVAMLNVVLLSLGAITLSAEIPARYQAAAFASPLILAAGAALMIALRRFKTPGVIWYAAPLLYLGASVSVTWLAAQRLELHQALAIEAALVAWAASTFVAWRYRVMKKSALWFGGTAAATAAGMAIYSIVHSTPDEAGIYRAVLETAQRVYGAIAAMWIALFAVGIVAAVAGLVAWFFNGRNLKAYRATWTARFSISMPATLFAIFTLSIWALVVRSIKTMAPDDAMRVWPPVFRDAVLTAPIALSEVMDRLLYSSARSFVLFAGALALFGFISAWAAIPSVIAELKHPQNTDVRSRSLGNWLSRGLRLVAVGGEVFILAFPALLYYAVFNAPESWTALLPPLLGGSALAVAALLTGKYFVPFRSAVDVMLDVDNYMRESPHDAAPRARIAERFASLLRHIDQQGYDRIVLVAHSQGTVISADALRFLAATNQLPATKIRLFTMGSPLKQLYAKAFPYLYDWVDAEPATNSVKVESWANVYCSGDYVGRDIWGLETDPALFLRGKLPIKKPYGDHCAGAGAHTHYWTGESADVGDHLDAQVVS